MKAIVIGAGIAGITTALSLQKFGIEYDLIESHGSLNAFGAGIWLAPNSLKVLESLDKKLLAEIKLNGKTVDHFGVTDHKGNPISTLEMQDLENRFGHRHVTIHRKRLIEILASYLRQPILFNKKYKSHDKNGTRIDVRFEDRSVISSDFIIACDGIGSAVREQNFDQIEERFSGQTCWRAIINHKVPLSYKDCFYEMWNSENRTRVGHAPISDDQIYLFITSKERKTISQNKNTKNHLADLVKDYAFDVQKAIESSNEEDWLCHELTDFKPLEKWFSNDVVLVGDSAHAMTPNMGQGGNQAIESAYCLALQLNKKENFINAFESYQKLRKERVDGIIGMSWKLGQLVNMPNGILKRIIIWVMKNTPQSIFLKQTIKQYTPIVE